jgi:predicted flap endonuclease-1-like 5' DNA nuclease
MKKVALKNESAYNVTFNYNVVAENPVESVKVLGDFNEWSHENAFVLKRNKKGDFEGTFKILAGRDYHFRYLVNGERWANEKDADRFEQSPLYAYVDNSVVSLPSFSVKNTVAVKAPAKKAAPKKETKSATTQKTAPAKKAAPKKETKSATTQKTAPAKKAAPKKETKSPTTQKAAPAKKAAPKKETKKDTVKKAVPAKKAAPKKSSPAKKDDLTLVEGIGPKIAGILNKAGINSFAELAKTKASSISDILKKAGKQYEVHNPTTWPKQSSMAAAGDWSKLEKWQSELKGGK